VSPIKGQISEQGKDTRSLRDAISAIDNEKDFSHFVGSYSSSIPSRPSEIKYERNPVSLLISGKSVYLISHYKVLHPTMASVPSQAQRQFEPSQTLASRQGAPGFSGTNLQQSPAVTQPFDQQLISQGYGQQNVSGQGHSQGSPITPAQQQHERNFSQGPVSFPRYDMSSTGGNRPNSAQNSSSMSHNGPPQLSTLPFQNSPLSTPFPKVSTPPPQVQGQVQGQSGGLLPSRPVFGMSLEQLFDRDGSAVPMIVYQCILAVDTYGLDTEGIYRVSGNGAHINKLKAMFDNGKSTCNGR
jgi:Rho GTPase-activating protein RGD1